MIRNPRCLFGTAKPLLYGNGRSVISISQWWQGAGVRPSDYYVQDSLQAQVGAQWTLRESMFRVLFKACLHDPSMNISINHLKKSFSLLQLIQLSAKQKQQLIDNPSSVIIKPDFNHQFAIKEGQIARNMLQLDKLFEGGVGLKTSYLIDWQSLVNQDFMAEVRNRSKAVSADVQLIKRNLADVVFQHGHKLEHVFLSTPYQSSSRPDLFSLLQAMDAIDFKGKLVLSPGAQYEQDLACFQSVAKKKGYSQKIQYSLQTDGWYTMI